MREGAGALLLLAVAHETGLIRALETALPADLPADNGRRHHKDPDSRRSLLLTLLFLPAVGLKRTHDLRHDHPSSYVMCRINGAVLWLR